ncbi:transmembrane protein, putative (macronuclear) [Tetrahymena thermophila SB210]|uniref:Transmembrane protein, putative n=1 Tax=Tetrahymena thermophila (strain SB210) TaxID=312017 RepID=W7XGT7_TETTS|nr:transmembrane protein, putative [Tetrahymena thermophila SB210]EWS72194.1 transmembrane protein, putative [Tetrahymena thermophila SB210]|eukprot:XP_012655287.1 transmembrane protein, putative [Tetrahymena thermophila SB210]
MRSTILKNQILSHLHPQIYYVLILSKPSLFFIALSFQISFQDQRALQPICSLQMLVLYPQEHPYPFINYLLQTFYLFDFILISKLVLFTFQIQIKRVLLKQQLELKILRVCSNSQNQLFKINKNQRSQIQILFSVINFLIFISSFILFFNSQLFFIKSFFYYYFVMIKYVLFYFIYQVNFIRIVLIFIQYFFILFLFFILFQFVSSKLVPKINNSQLAQIVYYKNIFILKLEKRILCDDSIIKIFLFIFEDAKVLNMQFVDEEAQNFCLIDCYYYQSQQITFLKTYIMIAIALYKQVLSTLFNCKWNILRMRSYNCNIICFLLALKNYLHCASLTSGIITKFKF